MSENENTPPNNPAPESEAQRGLWARLRARPRLAVLAVLLVALLSWSVIDRVDGGDEVTPRSNGDRLAGADAAEKVALQYVELVAAGDVAACELTTGEQQQSCEKVTPTVTPYGYEKPPEVVESLEVSRSGAQYGSLTESALAVVVRSRPDGWTSPWRYQFVYLDEDSRIIETDSPDAAGDSPDVVWRELGGSS